jgi:hypothetical protein
MGVVHKGRSEASVVNNETRIMELMAAGVPVTLLIDLAAQTPLESHEIYAVEGGDAGWLAAAV